jgi:hypothetical protein
MWPAHYGSLRSSVSPLIATCYLHDGIIMAEVDFSQRHLDTGTICAVFLSIVL